MNSQRNAYGNPRECAYVVTNGPIPYSQGAGLKENFLQGFGADNQGFQGRHHRTNAFLGQKWPKKAICWPKTVFLGPEWSQVGPHTLF